MMKNIVLLSILLINFSIDLFCQTEISSKIQDLMEELINETDDESEILAIYEHLEEVQQSPYKINLVSKDQLVSLYILTDFQIYTLLEYREKYGRILSIKELDLIMGFNTDLRNKLSTFLCIGNREAKETSKKTKQYSKLKVQNRYVSSFPKKQAFQEEVDSLYRFNGKNLSNLLKIQYDLGKKLRLGLTMESDAGEAFNFNDKRFSFEFNSGYLRFSRPQKIINTVILGDYRLNSGRGLIHGFGFSSKTSETLFKQIFPTLKKYSSTAESGFYRGLALNLSLNKIESIFYISGINESASLKIDEDSSIYFTTIDKSGLHRNILEENMKNNVYRQNTGFILTKKYNSSSISYTTDVSRFSHPFQYRKLPDSYAITDRNKTFFNQSISYNTILSKLYLSGEIALDKNRHIAMQQIITAYLHPLFTLSLGYRYYSPKYIAWLGKSFSESSSIRNEKGFYLGMETYPFRFLIFNAYIDNYSFPWIRYNDSSPYYGTDILLNGKWLVKRNFYVRTLFKKEYSFTKETSDISRISVMEKEKDHRFSVLTNYEYSDQLSFKNKLEIKINQSVNNEETGYLLYQEINKKFFNKLLSINFRYTMFDIPDWSVRIYSWEHDLLYGFSVPVFYKSGQNILFNFRYTHRRIKLGFKTSISFYNKEYTAGNGYEKRTGDVFSTWKFQWVYSI